MTTDIQELTSIEIPKILLGKKALISGVANKRSIAWSIAQALNAAGADIIFTYQNERLKPELEKVCEGVIENPKMIELDVTSDENLDQAFEKVAQEFDGKLDIMLHCLAFAPKETLQGGYVDTIREHFSIAQDISAYSLAAMSRKARPLMQKAGGGSIVTLTYLGAEKVIQNYNMMGVAKAALEAGTRYLASDLGPDNIRVNAISAGPIKTLAGRGISDFTKMLNHHAEKSCLKRNVTGEEVAGTALFLFSPLANGVTGEVLHVDCGYSIIG